MVIPVKGPNSSGPSATRERSGGAVERSAPSATTTTSASTTPPAVNLSTEGQVLSRIAGSLRNLPDVDSAKVAAIKEAVDRGDYKVNAERLAGRILDADDLF